MTERTASCPNCGAEIVFLWSEAIQTTCPACRSILVRHDVDLEKVGKVSAVPPSTSPIQIGTEGRFKNRNFIVVGRIIYTYDLGHWSEWHLRFADDSSGWLSDAQGEYAVTTLSTRAVRAGPEMLGHEVEIGNQRLTMTTITDASYAGVEGELPFEYWNKNKVTFLDLRGDGGKFATIDASEDPPLLFVGEFEEFDELRLKNLREVTGESGPAPTSKGLNCPSCGAAITLFTGALAQNVACPACGSIIDAKDPNFAILQGHQQMTKGVVPQIPLGSKGKLKGKPWQVIGYQIRGITVEGTEYRWREYLLWNVEAGFRYLTEYDGHWNDVTVIKGVPKQVAAGGQPVFEYLGTKFKHFQGARVTTRFVLGEFPWQVRVGDVVVNDDYVAPPLMLSREKTESEITWSLSTYTPPALIKDAFKLQKDLPVAKGVFANQPNPRGSGAAGMAALFGIFFAALLVLFVVRSATARKEQAFADGFQWRPTAGDSGAFVTRVFELKGRQSNVELTIATTLDNDWAYFNVALLPEAGGNGFELGREISRYSGYSEGEHWGEGSNTDRVILPGVPPGRYYLRVEPEHEGFPKPFSYTITVKRDVIRFWPFLIALLLLAIPPTFALLARASFESARWAESDHAPVASDDDDDE